MRRDVCLFGEGQGEGNGRMNDRMKGRMNGRTSKARHWDSSDDEPGAAEAERAKFPKY